MMRLHELIGPFDTQVKAHQAALGEAAGPDRAGSSILSVPQREALLLGACDDAGIEAGDYDRRIIHWIAATWEDSAIAVIVGLICRAHNAGCERGGM